MAWEIEVLLGTGANSAQVEALRQAAKRDAAEREVALLRDALEPFADIRYPDTFPDGAGFASRRNGGHVSYGDIRRARELLRSNAGIQRASPASGEAPLE